MKVKLVKEMLVRELSGGKSSEIQMWGRKKSNKEQGKREREECDRKQR